MDSMRRVLLLGGLVIVVALLVFAFTRGGTPQPEAERNRAFSEAMSGVTLVGYSTRLNREGLSGQERYRIDGVTHLAGDNWLFRTRLEHGGREIPAPIPLLVRWAGDTPVITLTDLSIPGVGTFTARVVIYREQYAGTWSGEGRGGQLFGRVIREASR